MALPTSRSALLLLALVAALTACSDGESAPGDAGHPRDVASDATVDSADTPGDAPSDRGGADLSDVGDANDASDADGPDTPGDADLDPVPEESLDGDLADIDVAWDLDVRDAVDATDVEDTTDAEDAPDATDVSDAVDADTADVGDTADSGDVGDIGEETVTEIRVVASNLTSGNFQRYEGPGIRILQALDADIALMQEFTYISEPDFEFDGLSGFVAGTFSDEHTYHLGPGGLPNGIVSRYPIVDAGTWDDTTLGNREFEWAQIDVPGPIDLWAVSLHLKASSGDAGQRSTQAEALVDFIEAHVPGDDYLVVGGDLNTYSRDEACIQHLSDVVETGAPWPVDMSGNGGTNAARERPYDWVLADADLAGREIPVTIGAQSFANGLVVDTREYTPLADLDPAQLDDSGVTNMQHMAVVRDFELACTPRVATVCNDGGVYWKDDCGSLGELVVGCDCGCDSGGLACRPCSCDPDPCNGAGTCSVVEGAAQCECESGCFGDYCGRCTRAVQPIAVGAQFSCVIEADGEIACWGWNDQGQAEPPPGGGFTTVAAGYKTACALDGDGAISCWGWDASGQATPPDGTGYIDLVLGYQHGCARTGEGATDCWGSDTSDQTQAPPGVGYIAISAGDYHNCALTTAGAIECWGSFGVSGIPSETGFETIVSEGFRNCALDAEGAIRCWGSVLSSPPSGDGFVDIAIGDDYGLAIDADGAVVCWGLECDDLDTDETDLLHLVTASQTACAVTSDGAPRCWGADNYTMASVPPTTEAEAIDAGSTTLCLRAEDGTLECIGGDEDGRSTPPGDVVDAFEMAARHGCALSRAAGGIVCWGNDDDGRATPPETVGYSHIAVGTYHGCAIDGEFDWIDCWGDEFDPVTTPPDGDFIDVGAGMYVSCAVLADTSLTCWGDELSGLLDAPEGTGFSTVATSGQSSCAIRSDGNTLACWGEGMDEVPLPGAFQQVAPGAMDCFPTCEQLSCGLLTDGSIECWGALNAASIEPPGGTNFEAISAGSRFMCALDADGVVQCWGNLVRPPALDLPL